MIAHILASLPRGQHSQENRYFYTDTFVVGWAWLAALFFFSGFRDLHKVIPGGVWTAVIICLALVGTSAFLLR